jgi:hypothetical protein
MARALVRLAHRARTTVTAQARDAGKPLVRPGWAKIGHLAQIVFFPFPFLFLFIFFFIFESQLEFKYCCELCTHIKGIN